MKCYCDDSKCEAVDYDEEYGNRCEVANLNNDSPRCPRCDGEMGTSQYL